MGLGDFMEYEKIARELTEEAHCRYCDFNAPYRSKCSGDVAGTAKQIAQVLERADIGGRIAEVMYWQENYIKDSAEWRDYERRLIALRKRLEELNGKT